MINKYIQLDTKLLLGKAVSARLKETLHQNIGQLSKNDIIPGLAAILVGDDPASQVYINNKEKAFKKLNCHTRTFHFPNNTDEKHIIQLIEELNHNTKYHGILVQLPLPGHLNTQKIIYSVSPQKDVDGFHPINLGLLLGGDPKFIPCTPSGIIEILKFYKIPISGRHAVIIGRSNIVGKPMFALLSQKFKMGNATVTICHTKTKNLKDYTKQAEILIAAVGVPNIVTGEMINPGVDIIDVGINRIKDQSGKGYHLEGDVNIQSVMGIANSITPVPGGVGPLTITMLLSNTVKSALIQSKINQNKHRTPISI